MRYHRLSDSPASSPQLIRAVRVLICQSILFMPVTESYFTKAVPSMRLNSLLLLFLFLLTLSSATFAQAQQQNAWIPQGIESLRESATSKTDFTFDHSMLVLASKLDRRNEDLRRVIAGVGGIAVRRFRFAGTWQYDPENLASVKAEYRAAGWKQLMDNRDREGNPGVTDVWIRLQNNLISNVAILLARANEVNFVEVSGSISPLDLSHLCGHFGIPKIEGGIVVPNTVQP
jgi:hypothetical protein